jgi:uncharacterized protein
MTLSKIFVLAALALLGAEPTATQARDSIQCSGKLSKVESMVCGTKELVQLDGSLNAAYSGAARYSRDRGRLKADQVEWLKSIRDKCVDRQCLSTAYRSRIKILQDLEVQYAGVAHTPLSVEHAQQVCTDVTIAEGKFGLSALVVPTTPLSGDPEWFLTLQKQDSPYDGVPSEVYELRLSPAGAPTRFASYFTGGSCASFNMLNFDALLKGAAPESLTEGFDDSERGTSAAPLVYRGRYFMGTWEGDNLTGLSWIKPNGTLRALCEFRSETLGRTVSWAAKPSLCAAVARDRIAKLPVEYDFPPATLAPHGSTDPVVLNREEYVRRYGMYADVVAPYEIDIDGDGRMDMVARFEYASSAGCGSAHAWLAALTIDHESRDLSSPLTPLFSQLGFVFNVFKYEGQAYVHATDSEGRDVVVSFRSRKVERVCEFSTPKVKRLHSFLPPN